MHNFMMPAWYKEIKIDKKHYRARARALVHSLSAARCTLSKAISFLLLHCYYFLAVVDKFRLHFSVLPAEKYERKSR